MTINIFYFQRNWTVNHDVGCKTYFDLESEILHPKNLTSNHTYCDENDTKYCPTKCPEILFDELRCALPRCPNITKDSLTFIYPDPKGAKLQNLPEPEERFDVNSQVTFECVNDGKKN